MLTYGLNGSSCDQQNFSAGLAVQDGAHVPVMQRGAVILPAVLFFKQHPVHLRNFFPLSYHYFLEKSTPI